MGWYKPRSKINTNKREAQKIATRIRKVGNFKNVNVVKRTLKGDRATQTPTTKGFWVKVKKK